uniref:Uncharacterized protein n=1 Tax=Pararge aegeria TaxID=116150 RepID=S4P8Y6_9NEOP
MEDLVVASYHATGKECPQAISRSGTYGFHMLLPSPHLVRLHLKAVVEFKQKIQSYLTVFFVRITTLCK